MGFKIKERKLNTLAVFEGVAGMTLGLERTGRFKTVAMVENAPDRVRVLKKNHPNTPILGDIRNVGATHIYDGENYLYEVNGKGETITDVHFSSIDCIVGGFPCQGHSVGGKKKGQNDERSGLWKEMCRLINGIKPRWVVIENVERLRKSGLGIVLHDLAQIGYDAEWHCITAKSVGYDHQRDRLFLVAYPSGIRCDNGTWEGRHLSSNQERACEGDQKVRERCQPEPGTFRPILSRRAIKDRYDANADKRAVVRRLRRVTDGVPKGVDETRRRQQIEQLGNAIVPDIPELIGERLWEIENGK